MRAIRGHGPLLQKGSVSCGSRASSLLPGFPKAKKRPAIGRSNRGKNRYSQTAAMARARSPRRVASMPAMLARPLPTM